MWDPAFEFAEIRRADAPGYERRFILRDEYGGRGSKELPGLMAALDTGEGCSGMVFRIDAAEVETVTEALWRREMISPGYIPKMIPVEIDGAQIEALTFLADHATWQIETDISRAEQVHRIAHASGILGSSRDYLENVVKQLRKLGISNANMDALLAEVVAAST